METLQVETEHLIPSAVLRTLDIHCWTTDTTPALCSIQYNRARGGQCLIISKIGRVSLVLQRKEMKPLPRNMNSLD